MDIAILEAYHTGVIAPHNQLGTELYELITNRDETTYLVAYQIPKPESIAKEENLNLSEDKFLNALKIGFSAATRALVSPPIDFAEAERRLLEWLRSSLPTMANNIECKSTALCLAGYLHDVAFDLTDGIGFEEDEDVSEETQMQRIDTLATLWLLRRAKEREEAKRHAALILDAVTTAAEAVMPPLKSTKEEVNHGS